MKKILILEPSAAGGRMMVETARELGYLVFGVTQKNVFEKIYEAEFTVKFADILFTNFSNEEKSINNICEYAVRHHIDGIVAGFEFMSSLTVKVANRLQLPTHDYNKANALRNKALMHDCFVKGNVPTAKTIIIDSLEQLKNSKEKVSFPVIIKPADNAGSCGVFKANNFEELMKYHYLIMENTIEFPHGFSLSRQVLLQEVLGGKEFSVEVAIIGGQPKVLCITDKMTTEGTYFAEMGHTLPSTEPKNSKDLINELACKSIKALGLKNGVAHVELKITKTGPKVIEVGARLPGDYIPDLIQKALGINEAEVYLKIALGEPVDLKPSRNVYAAIRFIPVKNKGIFNRLEFLEHEKENDFSFTQYVKTGESVAPSKDNISRIGHIICTECTYTDVISKCNSILNKVKVKIS